MSTSYILLILMLQLTYLLKSISCQNYIPYARHCKLRLVYFLTHFFKFLWPSRITSTLSNKSLVSLFFLPFTVARQDGVTSYQTVIKTWYPQIFPNCHTYCGMHQQFCVWHGWLPRCERIPRI